MPPTLGVQAPGIIAHVEEVGPLLVAELRRVGGARDMRLPAIAELKFRALAAVGAGDEENFLSLP